MYCGIVKSFNSRRGFGFLVCDEIDTLCRRDVFISRAECDNITLEAGDVVFFNFVHSSDGQPQALNARKCIRHEGVVTSKNAAGNYMIGNILRAELSNKKISIAPSIEVEALKSDVGILVLHPNDIVAFSVPSGNRQYARKVMLEQSAKPQTISSCFELDEPLACRGHTIDYQLILQLPEKFDIELLKKVLMKGGATTVDIGENGTSALATWPSSTALAQLLNHGSLGIPRDEGSLNLASIKMHSPSEHTNKIPVWPAPTMARTGNEIKWEPTHTASEYILQVVLYPSEDWVDLNTEGLPETGARIPANIQAVTYSGAAPILDVRLSYVSVCGCLSSFGHSVNRKHNKIEHKKSNMATPNAPEILRNTPNGVSIRWQAVSEAVHSYIIEVMREHGSTERITVSKQCFVELTGDDLIWVRVGYMQRFMHGLKLSPFSAKLHLPQRNRCTWYYDETCQPRKRSMWEQNYPFPYEYLVEHGQSDTKGFGAVTKDLSSMKDIAQVDESLTSASSRTPSLFDVGNPPGLSWSPRVVYCDSTPNQTPRLEEEAKNSPAIPWQIPVNLATCW